MSANSALFRQGLWTNNPIVVQVLGICSTLAVTNNMRNTLIMTLGVTFATAFSSWNFSLLKGLTPRKVRLILQVLIISFYVIIIDIVLKAFLPDISKQLGPYVGLIITNCILQGRQEAYAAANKPWPSFLDGLANGLGYMAVLMAIALLREVLGFGSVFGYRIMPEGFVPWTIMIMAPSAFFIVGFAIWISHAIRARGEPRAAQGQAKPADPAAVAG